MIWLLIAFFQLVTANDPTIITLSARDGPVDVLVEAAGDETWNVTARSLADEPVDVTLEILLDDRRLAFNDDHPNESELLAPLNAAILDFEPPQPGPYTLRLNSFSGAQSGEIEISLDSTPRIPPCAEGTLTINLRPNRIFSCGITLSEGQSLTVSARDRSGTLDPVLRLLSEAGDVMAMNDDHDGGDLSLNVLDSKIADFTIPETGRYLIQVSDFSGMAGELTLAIEVSPQ